MELTQLSCDRKGGGGRVAAETHGCSTASQSSSQRYIPGPREGQVSHKAQFSVRTNPHTASITVCQGEGTGQTFVFAPYADTAAQKVSCIRSNPYRHHGDRSC